MRKRSRLVLLVLIVILLVLVLFLVLRGCQQAAPTGLYFYSNERGNYDIYVLPKGDDQPRKIIATDADERDPYVVGDKIYFAANDDGDYDIYMANLDGSGRTKVVDLPNDQLEPVVSPNGRYLAFTSGSAGNYQVVLYDLEKGDVVERFGDPNRTNVSPTFVDDDTLLMTLQDYSGVFSQDPWIYTISSGRLDNPAQKPNAQEAQWRVQGDKVVFASMGLYGGEPFIAVAEFPSFNNVQQLYAAAARPVRPVFSPDGNTVAVSHAGQCRIIALTLDGKVTDTLYSKEGAECVASDWK